MFTILKDEILENHTCYVCKGYLTVEPIKVYQNRTIKCGRCTQADDSGTISLLNTVLKSALLPCQNKFEGCTELFSYEKVRKHEEKCPKGNFSCPITNCEELEMSAFQMLNHFQSVHKNNILKNNVICILMDQHQREIFLYRKENFLFIVKVDFNKGANDVRLGVSYIGPEELASKINYSFNIKIIKDNITLDTQKKTCSILPETTDDFIDISSYGCDAEPILLCTILIETLGVYAISYFKVNTNIEKTEEDKVLTHWDILDSNASIQTLHKRKLRLRHDFKPSDQYSLTFSECKTVVNIQEGSSVQTNNFICSACKNNIMLPKVVVFGCPCHKYNICFTCKQYYGFFQCKLGHPFTEQNMLTLIANSLEYSCKWNCEKYSRIIQIDHELSCQNNPLLKKGKCPLLDFYMSMHFQNKHHITLKKDYFMQYFWTPKVGKFIFYLWGYTIICTVNELADETMIVKFQPCDFDNFPHRLVAVLRIKEDNKIKFKVYYAKKFFYKKSLLERLLLTII